MLKSQLRGQAKFDEPVSILLWLKQPRANSDLDNRLKPLGDLIASVGAITNDKLVHHWDIRWSQNLPKDIAGRILISPLLADIAA